MLGGEAVTRGGGTFRPARKGGFCGQKSKKHWENQRVGA